MWQWIGVCARLLHMSRWICGQCEWQLCPIDRAHPDHNATPDLFHVLSHCDLIAIGDHINGCVCDLMEI
jgi:hypothetical protein